MATMQKKAFISYSTKDREFVEKLANDLSNEKFQLFFDKWEIKVGDSIVEKINDALEEMKDFIIILSKSSVNSNWVKKELSSGIVKKLEDSSIRILPVLKEECSIPLIIKDLKYANFCETYETGLIDLIDTLGLTHQSSIKINQLIPLKVKQLSINSKKLSTNRYKPRFRTEFKSRNNWELATNILLDLSGVLSGNQMLFCGNCSSTIRLKKNGKRPLVCINCGNVINWIGIETKMIKECPICTIEYPLEQNYCPNHYPAVQLSEKEIELYDNTAKQLE